MEGNAVEVLNSRYTFCMARCTPAALIRFRKPAFHCTFTERILEIVVDEFR